MNNISRKYQEIRHAEFVMEVLTCLWKEKLFVTQRYLEHTNESDYLSIRKYKNELKRLNEFERRFLEEAPNYDYSSEYISAHDYFTKLVGKGV